MLDLNYYFDSEQQVPWYSFDIFGIEAPIINSCSVKNCTATRSTVLLASVNSKPFHVNKNNSSPRTRAR